MAPVREPVDRAVRPPGRAQRALEAAWLPVEAAGYLAMRPMLHGFGRGDLHPVLILPGFTADDDSTSLLRATLRANGFYAHAWKLGRNLGPTERVVTGMRERLEELYQQHDRPVSLIGQSLGGIYARLLAREHPAAVRQVITLGSPYRMVQGDRSSVQRLWERVEHLHTDDLPIAKMREEDRPPLEVPATSIYSRSDGVAPWQTCIDVVAEQAENIEVRGSHIGMTINPSVVIAILDRLSQPADDWRPFAPPFGLRVWYPRPASWQERRSSRRSSRVAATA